MERVTSFNVDHIKLKAGLYMYQKDQIGENIITTFDIRITSPNDEPVMNTAEVHTIEHLGAVYLRSNPEYMDKIVYFGPMGCRTGFYLLMVGDLESKDILPLMVKTFEFIRDFEGEVPGAKPATCGNAYDINLPMAKYLANKYLTEVLYDAPLDRLYYDVPKK